MQFMVTWRIHEDKRVDVLEKWASMTPEQRADVGDGVTFIGRWHDLSAGTGVLIVETDDAGALFRYLGGWFPVIDLAVNPVLDDEDSAAEAARIVADWGA